jgi:hypothetical protein
MRGERIGHNDESNPRWMVNQLGCADLTALPQTHQKINIYYNKVLITYYILSGWADWLEPKLTARIQRSARQMVLLTEPTMGRERFLEGTDWLARSRRRRLRIGDLMVAVVMTAIGLSAISLPGQSGGERLFLGAITLTFLALQWAQWGLASTPTHPSRPGMTFILGIISTFLALAMFVVLIFLGLVFPQGAALLSVMSLIQVVYLTTWD